MLSLLWSALGLNRWVRYGILAAMLLSAVGIAVLKIRAGGIQSERVRTMASRLERLKIEAKKRAEIESITTAAARKRLRDNWSRR